MPLTLTRGLTAPATFSYVNLENSRSVNSLADLPTPVDGVIMLADNTAYLISGYINLGANRIVCGADTVLVGQASTIDGLINDVAGQPLITTTSNLQVSGLFMSAPAAGASVFSCSGDGTPLVQVVNCNIVSTDTVGLFQDINVILFERCGFVDCGDGAVLDGVVQSCVIDASVCDSERPGFNAVTLLSTCEIGVRVRISNSRMNLPEGAVVDADPAAIIPSEGMQLISNALAGEPAAGYVVGRTAEDVETYFKQNIDLPSTLSYAQMVMEGNASPTVVASANTWYKATGATSVYGDNIQRFTHSSNRLTYVGPKARTFICSGNLSASSGSNNEISLAVCVNGNFAAINGAQSRVNVPTTTRVECVPVMANVTLEPNDYVEIWVMNRTGATNITVLDINFLVNELS